MFNMFDKIHKKQKGIHSGCILTGEILVPKIQWNSFGDLVFSWIISVTWFTTFVAGRHPCLFYLITKEEMRQPKSTLTNVSKRILTPLKEDLYKFHKNGFHGSHYSYQ